MPKINANRLLRDLHQLRTFGSVEAGVVRPALTDEDMAARRWLAQRFEEAGLEATVDGLGNVLGQSRKPGTALLIGSHADTQPEGGWLDGAMGVIYALEIARACAEDPECADLAIDAIAWQDEEGAFIPLLGSRSFFGMLSSDMESDLRRKNGETLAEALRHAGLTSVPRLYIQEGRYRAYLEGHIEQGPYLDDAGEKIGVVTGVIGAREFKVRFYGEQNHAGTTPMARRKDAAAALIEFSHRINNDFPNHANTYSVWNIADVRLEPGSSSIVPGYGELLLQFRDENQAIVDTFTSLINRFAEEISAQGVIRVEVASPSFELPPTPMDERLQAHIARAAEKHAPGKWRHMPSGAGHDAIMAYNKLPCGMMFIPSLRGISHSFEEDTAEEDIVLGCQVLADAAAAILQDGFSG